MNEYYSVRLVEALEKRNEIEKQKVDLTRKIFEFIKREINKKGL